MAVIASPRRAQSAKGARAGLKGLLQRLAAILAAAAAASGAAAASAGGDDPLPVKTGHAESVIVPEKSGIAPGDTAWIAFAQQLEPGWHVYWKNPGDSGLPLDLKWRLPPGFSAGEALYPTPERIPVGPLANFGHSGSPAFLLPVTAPTDARVGDVVTIGVKASWLICAEICVPEEAEFELRAAILADPPPHPVGAAIVQSARAKIPEAASGLSRFSADAREIIIETDALAGVRSGFFFPYAEGSIEPAAPQSFVTRDGRLRIAMKPGFLGGLADQAEFAGVLAIDNPDGSRRGVEIRAARAENALAPAARPGGVVGDTPRLALAAFLGGLLLNLMPCVFPILFIKAASLASNAGRDLAAARVSGLAYGGGVIAMFAALGGLLIALRAGGEAVGWGFHLQSPAVVLLSAYVLFLVGLNLAGLFHVGESVQSAAGAYHPGRGAAGSFATGALAVFVAAPCIGPLLAAPMGAALMAPPVTAMAIFLALALGFAAPFSVLAFAPRLARLIPRPGAWMVLFRQAMAFPVFGAAAFFLWVLARQTGTAGLAAALAGAVLLAFSAWLFELSKSSRRGLVLRVAAAAAVATGLAPMFNLRLAEVAAVEGGDYGGIPSMPFDPAQVASLRAGGSAVFVDFTAAWCITCQVNKRTVLSRKNVASAFSRNNVALLTADWTLRDPEITAALESFGASGVPLYVYYPPAGEPKVLPQPLTEAAILAALGS